MSLQAEFAEQAQCIHFDNMFIWGEGRMKELLRVKAPHPTPAPSLVSFQTVSYDSVSGEIGGIQLALK